MMHPTRNLARLKVMVGEVLADEWMLEYFVGF
jgi:hypothetical protein